MSGFSGACAPSGPLGLPRGNNGSMDAPSMSPERSTELAALPQRCLRADRASALRSWTEPLDAALIAELRGGVAVLDEAVDGARRFDAGDWRHGRG